MTAIPVSISPHRSFSQLTTFQMCPHQWYLTKVAKVPEQPSLYMEAGSAVHTMLERINHVVYSEGLQGVRN